MERVRDLGFLRKPLPYLQVMSSGTAGESPGDGIACCGAMGKGWLVGWLTLRWGRLRDLGSGDEAWELRGKQPSVAFPRSHKRADHCHMAACRYIFEKGARRG